MYELITGKHPFYKSGMTKSDIIETLLKIREFKYPKSMSEQAKHLIKRLCIFETLKRFNASEAL
jgi:serine/threonine protein kinase